MVEDEAVNAGEGFQGGGDDFVANLDMHVLVYLAVCDKDLSLTVMSERSADKDSICPGYCFLSSSNGSTDRATPNTLWDDWRRYLAIARPMPLDAPVRRMTFEEDIVLEQCVWF